MNSKYKSNRAIYAIEDNSESDSDGKEVWCICRSTDGSSFMIACDNCEDWFHGHCVNVSPSTSESILKYFCPLCVEKNPHLKVEYKNSASRSIKKEQKPPKKEKVSAPSDNKPLKVPEKLDRPFKLDNNYKSSKIGCGECFNCHRKVDCQMCANCKNKSGRCIQRMCNRKAQPKSEKQAPVVIKQPVMLSKLPTEFIPQKTTNLPKKPQTLKPPVTTSHHQVNPQSINRNSNSHINAQRIIASSSSSLSSENLPQILKKRPLENDSSDTLSEDDNNNNSPNCNSNNIQKQPMKKIKLEEALPPIQSSQSSQKPIIKNNKRKQTLTLSKFPSRSSDEDEQSNSKYGKRMKMSYNDMTIQKKPQISSKVALGPDDDLDSTDSDTCNNKEILNKRVDDDDDETETTITSITTSNDNESSVSKMERHTQDLDDEEEDDNDGGSFVDSTTGRGPLDVIIRKKTKKLNNINYKQKKTNQKTNKRKYTKNNDDAQSIGSSVTNTMNHKRGKTNNFTNKNQVANRKTRQQETEEVMIYKSAECFNYGCKKPSRVGSKYCSDKCGMELAEKRLKAFLPARSRNWLEKESIATQQSEQAIQDLRDEIENIAHNLELLEHSYKDQVKTLKENRANYQSNANTDKNNKSSNNTDECSISCVTCGQMVNSSKAMNHMENCFQKVESATMVFADQEEYVWCSRKLFCDYRDNNVQGYCKRLAALCDHNKDPKDEPNTICAFPYESNRRNSICMVSKIKCNKHINWERISRAVIDMRKYRLLMRFEDLQTELHKLTNGIEQRGGVMNLLLNETIDHQPMRPIQPPNKDRGIKSEKKAEPVWI